MNLSEYIESGILEAYIINDLNAGESENPVEIAVNFPEVKHELSEIKEALERYALSHSVMPPSTIKPLLLATIDYFESMQEVDDKASPPELDERSSIADFATWFENKDMVAPADFSGIYAKIIDYTPEATTAIVWMKDMAPAEIHHNEYEKFLILEGTCTVTIDNDLHYLMPGDFLRIPLHKEHEIIVTSSNPCKMLLQRVAA